MNDVNQTALICFSHLRWNFVYQRPQHLMSRFARRMQVVFMEEPVYSDNDGMIHFAVHQPLSKLFIITPHFPKGLPGERVVEEQRAFIESFIATLGCSGYGLWYYTPMALTFSDNLRPTFVVYDCMDELSAFRFAPPELKRLEQQLMGMATVVFTGGLSLYRAKAHLHPNIHPFPSSIDHAHFRTARQPLPEPPEQALIPHPRIGYYGVIDERMDLPYVEAIARLRPHWHIVLIGPVAKIDRKDLPSLPNIHWLGMKTYDELPSYLAGWDVAFMPFARNEATQYISPTKTPEYLAAGKPVISTPIADVIAQYADVVAFAATAEDFVSIVENGLPCDAAWRSKVDALLAENSWDITWEKMWSIIMGTRDSNVRKGAMASISFT